MIIVVNRRKTLNCSACSDTARKKDLSLEHEGKCKYEEDWSSDYATAAKALNE